MGQFNNALTGLLAVSGASQAWGKGVRTERKLQSNVCTDSGLDIGMSDSLMAVMATIPMGDEIMAGLEQFVDTGETIGSNTGLLPEANDASVTGATIEDGMSGDTDFPFGNLKTLASVGERSVCPESEGWKITGTPDGLGAYLSDDDTVRVVVQSEGYGPLRIESFKWPVNDGMATFGGSHIQYVDYDREMLSKFMENEDAASTMVTGAGEMIETVINLKGETVGPRNGESETTMGAHYSNTDANGTYSMNKYPAESDWFFQSLCSAHLDQKHQWGDGIGFEDDVFLTNEEWSNFQLDKMFVGLSAHALDIETKTLYALGVTTQGGFEKLAEINPQHPDYVIISVSGYNGNFDLKEAGQTFKTPNMVEARNTEYGNRTDGNRYVYTKDIVPFRIYVGVKGKLEDGSDAPGDDFLARNGLKYGKMYGFAIDMRNETDAVGPTAGVWRDEWHKTAHNGDQIPGKWVAQEWQWDGEVRDFLHDGSWDYQNPPPGTEEGSDMEGYFWWNAEGVDASGCKTEHLSPDPRAGLTAFIQGSTCGYMGHLYVNDVAATLDAAGGGLPTMFDGTYFVYQGETDVTEQIVLGGAGMLPDGNNATYNWDDVSKGPKATFEDIDGLEIFEAADGNLYAMIQEDSGNDYGERMFISSPLEHNADGVDLSYYFVAMSGGEANTRQMAGVSVPKGTACHDGEKFDANAHEFSGLFDMSGLLRKDEDGNFAMMASDTGAVKIAQNAMVGINDKYILVGLQAGNLACGVIGAFQADRGGQWLLYQPELPVFENEMSAVGRQNFPNEESEDEMADTDGGNE